MVREWPIYPDSALDDEMDMVAYKTDEFSYRFRKMLEHPAEDIPTGYYPDESIDEDNTVCTPGMDSLMDDEPFGNCDDFTSRFQCLLGQPPEMLPTGYADPAKSASTLFPLLRVQEPEVIPTGAYTEDAEAPIPIRELLRTTKVLLGEPPPPDISEGLGKRSEAKDLAALEDYVAQCARWMVHEECLCLYREGRWLKFLSEKKAVKEIRRVLYTNEDFRANLVASDYKRIYNGLISNPDLDAPEVLKTPAYTINCRDGSLNLLTMESQPHCPADYFFYAFDISCQEILHPPMDGEYFEAFAEHIGDGSPDVRRQLLELLAIAMTGLQLKVFYAMLGPSHTGKSQWGRFMEELLGHQNVEAVRHIGDFADRFTTGTLYSKMLGTCLDLPSSTLPQAAVSILKQFCGDDPIKGEMKYKDSFTYYKKPLLLLAGNHPIRVERASYEDAFFNRLVIIPFSSPVSEHQMIHSLYGKFLQEAPYIIHEAAIVFQDLAERNFNVTRVPVSDEYAPQEGNHAILAVQKFVADRLSYAPDAQITTTELYKAYCDFAEEEGYPIMSHIPFSRILRNALKNAIPKAEQIRRVYGQDSRGYSNIILN